MCCTWGVAGPLADALLHARSRAAQLRGELNPHAQLLAALQQQAQEQRTRLEALQQEAKELELEAGWLKEVDVAFSRSGIPSFVLEGGLGDLQARCVMAGWGEGVCGDENTSYCYLSPALLPNIFSQRCVCVCTVLLKARTPC